MNAIAIGLFALVAGLLLAGLILMWNKFHHRRHQQRRQPGVESADPKRVKAAPWPDGWKGIPKSEGPGNGDGAK